MVTVAGGSSRERNTGGGPFGALGSAATPAFLFFFLFLWLPGSETAAHPYHTTTTQVEHNRERATLEIALKAWPEDLERALTEAAGEKVRLELTADVDQHILDYLRGHFRIREDDALLELRWVGKEISVRAAWLYFEIPVPPSLAGLELEQRVFFELQTDQLNIVEVRDGTARYTLSLHRDKPRAVLD